MPRSLAERFPGVHFYNPALTEVQDDVVIGAGSRVGSMTIIHAGAQIGSGVTIGSHCNICACEIGNDVSIQTHCHITRGVVVEDGVFVGPRVVTLNDALKDGPMRYPRLRKDARIGGGSTILPGVEIGERALVGAGSVVVKDVAPGVTVVGNPARPRPVSAEPPVAGV